MYTVITTVIVVLAKTPPREIYISEDNVIINHREGVLRLLQVI